MSRPRRALLPRLGPGAVRWWVAATLLLSAWVILLPASARPWELLPGDGTYPDLPGTVQYFWVLQEHGFIGLAHDRMLMWPATTDLLALNGFPLDALACQPLLAVFGWPAGFTIFQVLSLWCVGLSMAWLAGRWWRSPIAALGAGVAYQVSGPLVREMAYGRPSQVFAAIFAPLALGLLARALVERRDRDALLAGVMLGLSALAYWYAGFFYGLGLGVLLVFGLIERKALLRPSLLCAAGALAVVALPAAYTVEAMGHVGGADANLWTLVHHSSDRVPLAAVLEQRDIFGVLHEGIVGLTPLCFGAAAFALWRAPARRWAAPLCWVLVGVAFACGPWLRLSSDTLLPGPFAPVPMIPMLRRLWWPDRAMLLAAPAWALLAGGGLAALTKRWRSGWVALPVTGLLLVEAFLALPTLPGPTTDGTPSAHALALSRGTGPALVLPQGGAASGANLHMLLDQVFHGRPLVNGAMPPSSSTAPKDYAIISSLPAVEYLYQCVGDPAFRSSLPESMETLRRIGIRDVYLDPEELSVGSAEREEYVACVEALLGAPAETHASLRVYSLDR